MKKVSFILVFLVLFMSVAPVFSFAAMEIVQSPMYQPRSSVVDNGDGTYTYTNYIVVQQHYSEDNIGTSLHEFVSVCSVSNMISSLVWSSNNQLTYISNAQCSSVILNRYDINTGSVLSLNVSGSYVSNTSYNYKFNYVMNPSAYSNNEIYTYSLDDWSFTKLQIASNGTIVSTPFVSWAPTVPYVRSYSSYLSEPVADPYNRYIVLAGDDEQYIFLLSFSLSDLTLFNSQSVNQGADEVDLFFNNIFTPVLKLDNSQLKLELDIDSQIFYILNNTDDHLYKYNLMFAQYNLVDGSYVSSSLYSGSISSSTTSLAFDFGTYNDYDSIKTYGVQYIDKDTSNWHYNLLHCSWGHDPEFELWQDDILFYLQGIYESLVDNGSSEQLTTDPAVESGVNEYVSDEAQFMDEMESGESQVDIIFEDASSQFQSNNNGFAFVKEIFEDFIIGFPLPYTILFMSLVFGFVLVVIGRKVSKS